MSHASCGTVLTVAKIAGRIVFVECVVVIILARSFKNHVNTRTLAKEGRRTFSCEEPPLTLRYVCCEMTSSRRWQPERYRRVRPWTQQPSISTGARFPIRSHVPTLVSMCIFHGQQPQYRKGGQDTHSRHILNVFSVIA
jgi:hypothetical protein